MTREEAIMQLKDLLDFEKSLPQGDGNLADIDAINMAIKSLDAWGKVRAEIEAIVINGQFDEHTLFIRTGEQVKQMTLDIINKYKGESGDKEVENEK